MMLLAKRYARKCMMPFSRIMEIHNLESQEYSHIKKKGMISKYDFCVHTIMRRYGCIDQVLTSFLAALYHIKKPKTRRVAHIFAKS